MGRVCECFEGHQGGDCSEFTCPFGHAWADMATGIDDAHNEAECSNMGICDRAVGTCTCQTGFVGKACDRKECPSLCTDQGRCQSMMFYAESQDPGAGTVFQYTTNWDAEMIYGCNCDEDYYGPDCSLRECPVGDDPMTGSGVSTTTNPTQYNEIQRVSCKAGAGIFLVVFCLFCLVLIFTVSLGSFTLSFEKITTTLIPFNAKLAAIVAAIEALPNIGVGNIAIVMFGSQACTDTGTSFTVEFLQNFGPLPMMVGDGSLLSFSDAHNVPSITLAHQVVGTKENLPCGGRGTCDSATGYCTCSTNFDTSNGYNAEGTRGDCGNAQQTIQQCPGM